MAFVGRRISTNGPSGRKGEKRKSPVIIKGSTEGLYEKYILWNLGTDRRLLAL